MARSKRPLDSEWEGTPPSSVLYVPVVAVILIVFLGVFGMFLYASCRIDVPSRSIAVLLKKTGADLEPGDEIARSADYKGIQLEVFKEGRVFPINPYVWEWEIFPQVEVPKGQVGVVIRLFGDDLAHGELLAVQKTDKGIVPEPLGPGRYPEYSNPYAYQVEKHQAVTVPPGYHGVVTRLIGKNPATPNQILAEAGERGVQKQILQPGTYYVNPYVERISLINTRAQTLGLSDEHDMGFPSNDGFWIRLDGYVRFRVIPEKAPDVFVMYNEDANGDEVFAELVAKVIVPNARSFCRIAGSRYTGRELIQGTTREEFQRAFETKMKEVCEPLGIEVEEAAIAEIYPPRPIVEQLSSREIAKQEQTQYMQEILTQKSEAKLKTEQMRIEQKRRLIEAEREVIEMTTKAKQEQQVALTLAEQQLAVAQKRLEAAQDQAAAIFAKGKAEADVIRLNNEAEASGLRAAVAAFQNDGFLYAQNVLFEKLAPKFQQIMSNSADSPLMRIFERFGEMGPRGAVGTRAGAGPGGGGN